MGLPSRKVKPSVLPNFYGVLDMDEAESCLREQNRECCYLLRYSEARDENMLSVLRRIGYEEVFRHFDILINKEGSGSTYEIPGTEMVFPTMDELLDFYKENPLNLSIASIGDEIRRDTAPLPDNPPKAESGK